MKLFLPKISVALITALVAASAVGRYASASQTRESDFSSIYHSPEISLLRSGEGVLKYLGIIPVYNGALYLPSEVSADQVLENVPKRLEVKYLRAFKSEHVGLATIAGIKKNVTRGTYEQLASRIDHHNGLYDDIAPGDRVALTYIPDAGTRVEINGEIKGIVQGADFAEALFSLWLGDNPFDRTFKRALLGGK